jgi:hypothetical protein
VARALINENAPEWVAETDLMGKDGDPDAKYLIKPIGVDRYTEFEKRCTKRTPNKHSRAMEDVVDRETLRDMVLDFVLIGWEGILDGTTPVPCEGVERKKKLPGIIIGMIVERATQGGGGKTAEQRAESFRPVAAVV